MGGAQPLAATLNDARFLGVDVDPARIEKRLKTGYCDRMAWNLDEALAMLTKRAGEALSVGLVGNCADVFPELVAARHRARHSHRSDQRARSSATATCRTA